jgi:curved DNA-binding protein CbpA
MQIHTYYDNLKVTRDAPIEVIRAAYKALAQKFHPDRNPNGDTTRTMQLINEAWETLSNPELRRKHDTWIREQELANIQDGHKPNPRRDGTTTSGRRKGPTQSDSSTTSSKSSRWRDYAEQLRATGKTANQVVSSLIFEGLSTAEALAVVRGVFNN